MSDSFTPLKPVHAQIPARSLGDEQDRELARHALRGSRGGRRASARSDRRGRDRRADERRQSERRLDERRADERRLGERLSGDRRLTERRAVERRLDDRRATDRRAADRRLLKTRQVRGATQPAADAPSPPRGRRRLVDDYA